MVTLPRFCEFYPQDGSVGVFSYKMSALPTKMATTQFCLQDSGVSGSLPTRWRRAYKTAALPKRWRCTYKLVALPKKWWRRSFFPIKCRRYPQDGGVHTRWRRFWEFTHNMVVCLQNGGITHKMVVCLQDGGVTNKMAALPTRCLQDGDSAVFLRVLPTR